MTTIPQTAETANVKKLDKAVLSSTGADNLNPTAAPAIPGPSKEATQTSDLKEKNVAKTDTDVQPQKPPTPEISIETLIASGLIRFPFIPRLSSEVSTFTPTSFALYDIVHHMDASIISNAYFHRAGLPWHPFISRLYFGVLFYYQTLRAMEYAKIGNAATRDLASRLAKDLPPERLAIPGPLVPLYKAICCTKPDDPHFRLVCPRIPDNPGPRARPSLLSPYSSLLATPNIPLMLGLANSIIHAQPGAIPDYLQPASFDNTNAHDFSGFNFPAGDWNQEVRSLLCQPGMHRTPESDPAHDIQFSSSGASLYLPLIDEGTNLFSLTDFVQFQDINWIESIIPTMSHYCSFFKDAGNLGSCAPYGPSCPLIRSRFTRITSATAATNISLVLTAAFPNKYPYALIYDHRSFELNIPQPYAAMGQYAAINTMANYRGLNNWSRINIPLNGREGSYWNRNPSTLSRPEDTGFAEIPAIIQDYYYIRKPN